MKKKLFAIVAILLVIAITAAGCAQDADPPAADADRPLVVGYAQSNPFGPWKVAQNVSIQEAVEAQGWTFLYAEAIDDIAKQVADIEDFVNRGVDFILVSPMEMYGLQPGLDAAREAGIPVIIIDREIDATPGVDFLTFIGADFYLEGQLAGQHVAENFPGARVVEITGTPASSVARDRGAGFHSAIEGVAEVISTQNGDFSRQVSERAITNVVQAIGIENIDVIFAQSDEVALGVIAGLQSLGIRMGEDVHLVSIDGQKLIIDRIKAGEWEITVLCSPHHGPPAVEVILNYLAGETIPPAVIMPGFVFNAENAEEYYHKGI